MPTGDRFAVIILAAGSSRRMKRPKLLMEVGGRPMIRIATDIAAAGAADPVVVVLGANQAEVEAAIARPGIHCIFNPQWREGMGASLRHGIQRLVALSPDCCLVIVMLADQPGLPPDHLRKLVELHRATGKSVVATEADGILQAPALFSRHWFSKLAQSRGDRGARALFQDAGADLAALPLKGLIDIDTPDDYRHFLAGPDARP